MGGVPIKYNAPGAAVRTIGSLGRFSAKKSNLSVMRCICLNPYRALCLTGKRRRDVIDPHNMYDVAIKPSCDLRTGHLSTALRDQRRADDAHSTVKRVPAVTNKSRPDGNNAVR